MLVYTHTHTHTHQHTHPALCVVGNKCDLVDEREVTREKGEEFAHELGAMFTETSAAENIGEHK